MSVGSSGIVKGLRPLDWVLAGALTALGVWLMVENVVISDAQVAANISAGTMVHEITSHSWAMVPVFAVATVPVLWWRRNVIVVTGIAVVAMAAHDLVFGWVTRCGAGLPLAFVLAYLGAASLERRRSWIVVGPRHDAHGSRAGGGRHHRPRTDRARVADRADRLRHRSRRATPYGYECRAAGAHGRAPAGCVTNGSPWSSPATGSVSPASSTAFCRSGSAS